MKNFFHLRLGVLFVVLSFLVNPIFAKCIAQNRIDSTSVNSNIDLLYQNFIDARINKIDEYNLLCYKKEKLSDSIDLFRSKIVLYSNDTERNNNFFIDICAQLNNKNHIQLYDSIKNTFAKVINAETKIKNYNLDLKEALIEEEQIQNQIDYNQLKYNTLINEIKNKTDTITGFYKFNYNGKRYLLFYANNKKNEIKILGNTSKNAVTIKSVLSNCKETPLMITNGGMYQPNYQPQGLLISNGIKEMDIDSSNKEREGNFYLYPNGIFFIDTAQKFHIYNTPNFIKTFYKTKAVKYATQSGPLLLDNGKLNEKIKANSNNYYIRSGVGVINENRIIFVISEDAVTFYDFKMVFTALGCYSALYFDGFVSRMYKNDKYPQRANVISDYNFGPMITVFPKR